MCNVFYKFYWLLKKNLLLFWRSRFQALIIFFIPLILTSILVIIREKVVREPFNHNSKWDLFKLDVLTKLKKNIVYCPKTENHTRIMDLLSSSLSVNVIGFENESELLQFFHGSNKRVANTIGAVVFNVPTKPFILNYTIRLHSKVDWETRLLFPTFPKTGPRSNKLDASPPSYLSLFLFLQNTIDQSLMKLYCKYNLDNLTIFKTVMKRFPYPPYIKDEFSIVIQRQLALVLILSFMFPVLYGVRFILVEKQKGMKVSLVTIIYTL